MYKRRQHGHAHDVPRARRRVVLRSGLLTQKMAVVVVAGAVSWRILYICAADTCTHSSGVQPHGERTRLIRADGGGLEPAAVNPAQRDLVPPPQTRQSSHSRPRAHPMRRCAALHILHADRRGRARRKQASWPNMARSSSSRPAARNTEAGEVGLVWASRG